MLVLLSNLILDTKFLKTEKNSNLPAEAVFGSNFRTWTDCSGKNKNKFSWMTTRQVTVSKVKIGCWTNYNVCFRAFGLKCFWPMCLVRLVKEEEIFIGQMSWSLFNREISISVWDPFVIWVKRQMPPWIVSELIGLILCKVASFT